ncbi:hypothetical protein BU16DRAFT_227206 [Lophium mytilinum]|uniref:Uncharacterized protein n=1 Tax=Lophium mytilinum TaxID=390894 RepID=A0A6A6Q925_9PEZI|nr:hypothetical protein BU16DRAFT_227206 [Lophium mytilinum]
MEPALIYQDMARNGRPRGERTMRYRSRDQDGMGQEGEVTYWLKDSDGATNQRSAPRDNHLHPSFHRHQHQHRHHHQNLRQNNYFGGHDEERHRREVTQALNIGRHQGVQFGRNQGVQLGHNRGVQLGRQQGLQYGRQQGAEYGRRQGIGHAQNAYQNGQHRGFAQGRSAGYRDGHHAGHREGRDLWGPNGPRQPGLPTIDDRIKEARRAGYKQGREDWGPDIDAVQRQQAQQREQPSRQVRPVHQRRQSVHGGGYVDHGYVFQGYEEPDDDEPLSAAMGQMRLDGPGRDQRLLRNRRASMSAGSDRPVARRQSMSVAERPRSQQGYGGGHASQGFGGGQRQLGGPRLGQRGMLGPNWDHQQW